MTNQHAFPYSEKLAAKRFGIPRDELREARKLHLEPDVDWKKNGGGAVLLSERGLKRLLNLTSNISGEDLSAIDVTSLLAEKNGAAPPDSQKKLAVVAICPNPRMVLANDSGNASQDRQLVDVGSNINFAVGDVIEVTRHASQQGIWQLASPLPGSNRRLGSFNGSLRAPGIDQTARKAGR